VSGARNRRMGAAFETALTAFFRGRGCSAERLRLSGREDEGDISVRFSDREPVSLIVEAKAGKNIRPWHWFREEAVPEAAAYRKRRGTDTGVPCLVMKAHNRSIGDALVCLSLSDFMDIVNRDRRED